MSANRVLMMVFALCAVMLLVSCAPVTEPTHHTPTSGDVSVYGASWSGAVDNNSNGYAASAVLTFDVDVTNSATTSVYAVVYYRVSGSGGTWNSYYETWSFTITGTNSSDAQDVTIDGDLPRDSYEFRIDVYDYQTDALVASAYPANDGDLAAQDFETTAQDAVSGTVYYTLVNGTWANMQLSINGVVVDTIVYKDSITYTDPASSTGLRYLYMKSIVATSNNYLYWADTITRGTNFRMRYFARDVWFQLYVVNNTDKNMNSAVVSSASPFVYDSSYAYVPMGGSADIGFYQSSTATNFRFYYTGASQYTFNVSPVNTVSITGEALLQTFTPSGALTKGLAGGVALKPLPVRPVRTYDFQQYLQSKGLR
jgi:hypothetical protein